MRAGCSVWLTSGLLFSALAGVTGCEGLVAPPSSTDQGKAGHSGGGGSGVGDASATGGRAGTGGAVVAPGGTGGTAAGTGGGVAGTGGAIGGSGGAGAGTGGAAAGTGGRGTGGNGSIGTGGASNPGTGGATPTDCSPYPTAPAIENTSFKVGTVVPNLVFTREDGSQLTFQDIRCNKRNRLLYWTTGGDNCSFCWDNANDTEVPAAKELGPKGFVLVASFNGSRYLVGSSPWKGWRRYVPIWPATDTDYINLVSEPATKPFYAFDRITFGLPWEVTVDMETMKVISVDSTPSLATLRTQLNATTPRP